MRNGLTEKSKTAKNFKIMLSGILSTPHNYSKTTKREPYFITQNYLRLFK